MFKGKLKVKAHLFIWYTVTHVLQIPANILNIGVAKEDLSKIFLADGGHAFGVGEELYLKHLCLQVVHEPEGGRQTAAADRKRHRQKLGTKEYLTWSITKPLTVGGLVRYGMKMINGRIIASDNDFFFPGTSSLITEQATGFSTHL